MMQVQQQEVRRCTDVLAKVAEDIQTRQRDMSRDVIEPTVQDTMTEAYAACCAEAGPGQFDRMRRLMKSAVQRYKSSMFAEAASKAGFSMICPTRACLFILTKHSFKCNLLACLAALAFNRRCVRLPTIQKFSQVSRGGNILCLTSPCCNTLSSATIQPVDAFRQAGSCYEGHGDHCC